MISNPNEYETKIDFNELVSKFRISDNEIFKQYLAKIWTDLHKRSDNIILGINKPTFFHVMHTLKFSTFLYQG